MPLLPRSARRALDRAHLIRMEGKGNPAKPSISPGDIRTAKRGMHRPLDFIAEGDTLVVTKLDRLARQPSTC